MTSRSGREIPPSQATPRDTDRLTRPAAGPEALADLAEAVTGSRTTDPVVLGAALKRNRLTYAVLNAFDGTVRTYDEVLDVMRRSGARSWDEAITTRPQIAAVALTRFVALLAVARAPEAPAGMSRPLVQIEVHQWARSVTRMLRGVLPWPKAEFAWDTTGAQSQSRATPNTTTSRDTKIFLPAVYCRECGRSGWSVLAPESDLEELSFEPHKIRRATVTADKAKVRTLVAATDNEAREGNGRTTMDRAAQKSLTTGGAGVLMMLDGLSVACACPTLRATTTPRATLSRRGRIRSSSSSSSATPRSEPPRTTGARPAVRTTRSASSARAPPRSPPRPSPSSSPAGRWTRNSVRRRR